MLLKGFKEPFRQLFKFKAVECLLLMIRRQKICLLILSVNHKC